MTAGTGRSSRYPPAAHGCSQPQQVQLPSKVTILSEGGKREERRDRQEQQIFKSLQRYMYTDVQKAKK